MNKKSKLNILNNKRNRTPTFKNLNQENFSSTSTQLSTLNQNLTKNENINTITNNNNINNTISNNKKIFKENKEYNNHNNNYILFKKNPNIKYITDIIESNDFKGFNNLFEVYKSIKDNKIYLISPNNLTFKLDIIELSEDNNNKLIKSLEGHKNHITTVRYFTNDINEYLISADINNVVILWDIQDITNKIEKYKIKLKYTNWIYSCLLFFNDYLYIFTSCCGRGNTKVYLFNENDINFLKNVNNSKNNNTYYLLSWYNEKNNNYYIIEFCKNKIVLTDIYTNNLYANLITEDVQLQNSSFFYMNGYIYNSYLYACSMNGYINIWDLYEKILINSIHIYNSLLSNIIQWNEKYNILIDGKNNSIKIMDLSKGVIISDIYSQHENSIISIKKVRHPIYGESLLSSGQDGYIKLWST